MSEIDDIFASKGKPFSLNPQPSTSTSQTSKKKNKNKNIINTTALDQTNSSKSTSTGKKRPPPETIVDSSSKITSKRFKLDKPAKPNPKMKASRTHKEAEDEATFKDSRGTLPRRTTEEGWLIYKEDELGIGEDGGDTPLCPFDCDCCFRHLYIIFIFQTCCLYHNRTVQGLASSITK